jgi:hypothetical protein
MLTSLEGPKKRLNLRHEEKLKQAIRISMVDDASLYSKKLLEGLKECGVDCVFYGPSTPPKTK